MALCCPLTIICCVLSRNLREGNNWALYEIETIQGGGTMTRSLKAALISMVLICIAAVSPNVLRAQEYRGSLSGRVTDQSGAVIPSARITVKNIATGTTQIIASSKDGNYQALNLDAGMYTITVSAPGFRELVQQNVEIRTGEKLGLDLGLQVGATTEEVVVTTQSPQLITDTGSGGTVLDQMIVNTTPLLGSNVLSLIATTAGALHAPASDHLSERPFDNGGMDAYTVNGGPTGGNNNSYLIDGAPNNNNEGAGFVPPPDAVTQVNVLTNAYDAEMGRTGGAITSIALKTGTNAYHGVVYWNVRNDHFDASLSQNVGKPRQVTQWSEPGFQIGGPISIPHLYDGRNRSFFSVSFEHFFDKVPSASSRTVDSASQIAGNFCSGAPGNNGIGTVIYDPTTTTSAGARTAFGGCPAGQTGSLIPANRIDPVMAAILANGAQANIAGCSNPRTPGCTTNFTGPYGHGDVYHALTVRIDQNFSATEKFFASYEDGNRVEYYNDEGAPTPAAEAFFPISHTSRINHGATANITSILSPTFTSTAKINWLRHNGLGDNSDPGVDPTSVGLSPVLTSLFRANNFPGVTFTGSSYNQTEFGVNRNQNQPGYNVATLSDTWTAQETLNKVVKSHSLKGGAGTTIILQNNRAASRIPILQFSDQFTRQNYLTASSTTGDAVASALLGYPTTVTYTTPLGVSWKTSYVYLFAQDDWRVSKRLTLNFGLRYDFQTPPHERYNRAVTGFNPGVASVGAGANAPVTVGQGASAVTYQPTNGVGGSYLGGLTFADSNNRSPFANDFRNFGPRFGFAYQVSDKMVVRGGWGRFYDYAGAYNFPPTTGFTSTSTANVTPDSGATPTLCASTPGCAVPASNSLAGLSANGFASIFPAGLVPITGNTLGAKTGGGTAISFIDPQFRPAYVNQFNLAIEYQLPGRVLFHAEYNGSRSHNVDAGTKNLNNITATQFVSQTSSVNFNGTAKTNPFAGLFPGTTFGNPNSSITNLQLLLPYPQFTQVNETHLSIGRLWYNSLQLRAEKRLSHGLTVLSNFTYGKNIGTIGYLNPNYDPIDALTRQPVAQDYKFSGNVVMNYQLPIFSSPDHPFLHSALGGWTMSGTVAYGSGTLVGSPGAGTAIYRGVNPGKYIPGVFEHHTRARWFNNCVLDSTGATILASSIAAGCPATTPVADVPWQQPANSFFLNNIPPYFESNRLPRPPITNLAIFKAFAIGDKAKFEIRADAFNLTNTPLFGTGDNSAGITTTPTSASFAVINANQGNDPRTMQLSGRLSF